ncbi:hypothetical protein [Flindersiella endophytica]
MLPAEAAASALTAALGEVLDRVRAGRRVDVDCVGGHGHTETPAQELFVAGFVNPEDDAPQPAG